MPKYRKIPVTVEAVKITRTITIETSEGAVKGLPGDYLITEANGDQYPIRADIFEATYERVKTHKDVKMFMKKVFRKMKRKSKDIFMNEQ
ncbi:hypothetical protein [Alkalihalobacterium alkalinitrilicum]|uniref:hypothetical protein n=1 Tax=Alkalihalobacterium alkalinitrilicum TaxID=427920 RepID=UPI0015D5DB01|nr:hypothetical protein [Alkalihalobacterium alkalinitrilicum]